MMFMHRAGASWDHARSKTFGQRGRCARALKCQTVYEAVIPGMIDGRERPCEASNCLSDRLFILFVVAGKRSPRRVEVVSGEKIEGVSPGSLSTVFILAYDVLSDSHA